MRNCKTCKHWDRHGGTYNAMWTDDDFEFHTIDTGARKCLRVLHSNSDNEAQISKDSELAFTTERDHYLGSLQTRPDFGCVLHELRSENPDFPDCPNCGLPDCQC